jgi:hypothetical protein
MALMAFSTVEIANQLVLPQLDSVISCRQLAKKLLQDGVREEDLAVYGIPRTLQYGLDYYMNRELPRWAASADEPKWVLVGLPLGRRIANEYEIVDDNPLDRYIPTFSLYRKR